MSDQQCTASAVPSCTMQRIILEWSCRYGLGNAAMKQILRRGVFTLLIGLVAILPRPAGAQTVSLPLVLFIGDNSGASESGRFWEWSGPDQALKQLTDPAVGTSSEPNLRSFFQSPD